MERHLPTLLRPTYTLDIGPDFFILSKFTIIPKPYADLAPFFSSIKKSLSLFRLGEQADDSATNVSPPHSTFFRLRV